MKRRVKIFTHETVVHSQIAEIERILMRKIDVDVTLNSTEARSNLQFDVSQEEIVSLRSGFGYTLLEKTEGGWLPVI